MSLFLRATVGCIIAVFLGACSVSPPIPLASKGQLSEDGLRKVISERLTMIVVTEKSSIDMSRRGRSSIVKTPKESSAGSAAPITLDGYFLTAEHVVYGSVGKNILLIYKDRGVPKQTVARVVWGSPSGDLALLHAPIETPYFYRFTPRSATLQKGHPIVHGGVITGSYKTRGKLRSPIFAESIFTGSRSFKIDLPLRPGDSGGPILDLAGNLIGINSAVEFILPLETPIFLESEGKRPNLKRIFSLIQRDRVRRR